MTPEETLRICRLAKALSPAQAMDEFTPEAWAVVLAPFRVEDATEAIQQLGGEQEWIHVSHIVARIKRIRRDRILAFGPTDPPAGLDDAGYHRWLVATQKAIADGTMTQPPALPPAADPPPEIAAQYADVLATTGEMP